MDPSSQPKNTPTLNILILTGLSILAIFFIINDKDIQISHQELRKTPQFQYLNHLTSALQQRINRHLNQEFCEQPSIFFKDMPIDEGSSLQPLDQLKLNGPLSLLEKEALNRCQVKSTDPYTIRVCLGVKANHHDEEASVADIKSSFIELHYQVRDFRGKRPVPCELIFNNPPKSLGIVSYFSIYWKTADPDDQAKVQLHKTNGGFQIDLPYDSIRASLRRFQESRPM